MPITPETLRLVERMRRQVGTITDQVSRGLAAAWVAAWDDLADLFLGAASDLITLGAGAWPARGKVLRARRVLLALDQSGAALEKLAAKAATDITDGARRAADLGASGQPGIIASQLPHGSTKAAAVRHRQHQPDAIDAVVRRAAEQITARTRSLSGEATDAMQRELVRGVVLGENPGDAAAAMVQRVEGRFNGGLARAETISRTEILGAHREAAAISQAGHEDVLAGWIWHAAVDGPTRTRVCPSCWRQHGTLYPLSEPGPQDHHQGRCSRTPKTRSWADLGFDVDEPPDELPDSRAIFDALPRAEQLQIMGPARLAMLDSGAIGWADLSTLRSTPGWRDAYHVTPVADLRALASDS